MIESLTLVLIRDPFLRGLRRKKNEIDDCFSVLIRDPFLRGLRLHGP